MGDDADWLTGPQAAELVGCPLSTVEHYIRTGRIERRRGPGRTDGSLRRASVEEFAEWWHERAEGLRQRKADRAARRRDQPMPDGWIRTARAAELLGYTNMNHIAWLVAHGRFTGRKVSGRWWVREDEVREFARERDQWVSQVKAARIVGCSVRTIERAATAGKIEKRDVHRTQASLSLRSVRAFRQSRHEGTLQIPS